MRRDYHEGFSDLTATRKFDAPERRGELTDSWRTLRQPPRGVTLRFEDMRRAELRASLYASRDRSCIVDRSVLSDDSDILRSVVLHAGGRVSITFDTHETFELDEGGLSFVGDLTTDDDAVAYLERYLGRPFSTWQRTTGVGKWPVRGESAGDANALAQALQRGLLPLPDPRFRLTSERWRPLLPFPSRYR